MQAKQIADYFLSLVNEQDGDFLTNLKIQKLLYYAQGFSLAVLRYPIFDEEIVAWNFGPVVVEVYDDLKQYGNAAVPTNPEFDLSIFTVNEQELLNEVYEVYGQFSPSALVEMTHNEPPWKKTKRNNVIPHNLLQDYFSTQIIS